MGIYPSDRWTRLTIALCSAQTRDHHGNRLPRVAARSTIGTGCFSGGGEVVAGPAAGAAVCDVGGTKDGL